MTGRPTKLDQPCRTLPDGTTITAAEHLVEQIRLGLDYQTAADHTGVSRQTLHTWRLTGARHRAAETQGTKLTELESKYVNFLDALERAHAEAEADRLAVIEGAATGGRQIVKTTERVLPDGRTETVTVTETARPEWTAAAWILERRMPGKYARRVEVTGAEGAPLVPPAQQARDLADSLRDFQLGAAAAAELEEEKTAADG